MIKRVCERRVCFKAWKRSKQKTKQVVHYAEITILKCKQFINVVRVKNGLILIGEVRTLSDRQTTYFLSGWFARSFIAWHAAPNTFSMYPIASFD